MEKRISRRASLLSGQFTADINIDEHLVVGWNHEGSIRSIVLDLKDIRKLFERVEHAKMMEARRRYIDPKKRIFRDL